MKLSYKSPQILIVLLLTVMSCNFSKDKIKIKNIERARYLYGIKTNLFEVIENKISRNKNLSDILLDAGLPYTQIFRITQCCQRIFDVRKIKAGNPFTCFYAKNDKSKRLHYFVYEINKSEFVALDLHDTTNMQVIKGHKPVTYKERRVEGVVNSSLWDAMVDKGMSPNLAMEMANKFAWQVDFFAIQKGDFFKVVYVEEFIDSKSVGVKELKFAQFNQGGENYFAIPFPQKNGKIAYYDEKGHGMKKAFLKAPLQFSRISSYFSEARFHPVLRIVRPHHGVDYAAPTGTPVMAIGNGIVEKVAYSGGGGNTICIKHTNTYTSSYMHLSRFANIHVGSKVQQGQIIGYVGMTGLATGPHLDFRIYKNGGAVNPLKIVSPPADPVTKGRQAEFNHVRDSMITILNAIK